MWYVVIFDQFEPVSGYDEAVRKASCYKATARNVEVWYHIDGAWRKFAV